MFHDLVASHTQQIPELPLHRQSSTSSSEGPSRVPIERAPSSSRTSSSSSPSRHRCSKPGCNTSCKRPDDLRRHVRTCHDCASGPFWLCDICGHWEYASREDKMNSHYDSKHGCTKSQRPHSYQSVSSVGRQAHIPKPPTSSKFVRRHKFKVPEFR